MTAGPDDRRAGPAGGLPGEARPVLLALGAVLVLVGTARIGAVAVERYGTNDFAHYYLTSQLLLDGQEVYRESLEPLYREHGFTYQERIPSATNPPALVALFVPFALLPPEGAYWLWAVIQLGALVGSLWLLRPWIVPSLGPRGPELWWLFAGSVAVSNAVYFHFYHSQVQLLLLFLLLLAFRLQAGGRHRGALLAALAAGFLKLFPLALFPWFAWKARRDRGAWVLAGAAALGLAVLTAGLWPDFVSHATRVIRENTVNQTMNFSLPSLAANLGYAAADWSPARPGLLWGIASALGLVVLAGAYVAWALRGLPDRQAFSLLLAAAVAGGLTAWPHYLVLLVPGFALATVWALRDPTWRKLAGCGLLYLFGLNVMTGAGMDRFGELVHILVNYLPLYALLGLLLWLAAGPRLGTGGTPFSGRRGAG